MWQRLARLAGSLERLTPTGVVLFLFALSVLVQAAVLWCTPLYCGNQAIYGGPVADAWFWHKLAAEIAQGKGIETPLRPMYSILLALVFQFTGHALVFAKAVNVALSSITIALVYLNVRLLCGRNALAMLAALSLLSSPQYLLYSHGLLTEHAGLAFSMASLYFLLRIATSTAGAPHVSYYILGAVMMGLSNLARPQSLFAFPMLFAYLLFWPRSIGAWARATRATLFACVLFLTILPWLIHQKAHYGIFTISHNSAEALYAASDPRYGQWTGREGVEAIQDGFKGRTVSAWYAFYLDKARDNITRNPRFYLGNVARKSIASLNVPAYAQDGSWYWILPFFAAALLALLCPVPFTEFGLQWRARESTGRGRLAQMFVGILCLTLAAAALLGPLVKAHFLPLFIGMAAACAMQRSTAFVAALMLIGCVGAHTVFGFDHRFDRVVIGYLPLLVYFNLVAVHATTSAAFGHLSGSGVEPHAAGITGSRADQGAFWRSPWRSAFAVAGLLLLVAIGRLVYLNLKSQPTQSRKANVTDAAKAEIIRHIAERDPKYLPADRTSLVMEIADMPFSVIDAPSRVAPEDPDDFYFRRRAYTRQIGYVALRESGSHWTVFPGRQVNPFLGLEVSLVAKRHCRGAAVLFEAIAMVPFNSDGTLNMQAMVIFDARTHGW
jgi:4-amino-4-deoxy-L-arabinose transferase-like glycosyltransferase